MKKTIKESSYHFAKVVKAPKPLGMKKGKKKKGY